jgi:hypothetical protein
MGGCFIGVDDMSCVGVNVSGLRAAFFRSGSKHLSVVIHSVRSEYVRGVHEILDSLVEDVERLSLVSQFSLVGRFFCVRVHGFEVL